MLSLPFLFIYLALISVLTHLKPVLAQPLHKAFYFKIIESLVEFADQSHYIGRWSVFTPSQENQSAMAGFMNSQGVSLVSRKRDIVLMDGEYLFNTKFVSIEIDIYDEAEEKRWDKKSTKVEGRIIKYKVGDNLNDLDTITTQECKTKELTIIVMDAKTPEKFDSLQDEKQKVSIGIYIIGGECPFDFLAIFTPDSENRYLLNMQLICCIWLIANMILRKWFRTRGPANKIQIVQSYLLSFIDNVVIWDLFIFNKDIFSENIRTLAFMSITFVYTPFPAEFDDTYDRIIATAVTCVGLLVLQWGFAIQYNPAGITLIFIAIPLLEFVYNFNVERRIKYDKFLYLGTLLPLLAITLLNSYQKRVFYVMSQPYLRMLWIVFFWIAFVLLPLQEHIVNNVSKQVREKYLVSVANINPEDSCPICLDNLIPLNSNSAGSDRAIYELWTQSYPRRIIKTNCGHIFHEDCLIKWLRIKLECGLCRAPVFYLI